MSRSIWQILGVPAKSDRDTIRRAYAKQLRVTNPEDDPEGFMALREAYESALERLRWQQDDDAFTTETPLETAEIPTDFPDVPADSLAFSADSALDSVDFTADFTPEPPRFPAENPAEPAETPPISTELRDYRALRATEANDLRHRQQALLDALAAADTAPETLNACLDAVLAAPLLLEITARAGVEDWLADVIARHVPASDPLVRPTIDHFGWGDRAAPPASPAIRAVLQRLEEGLFAADAARPHAPLHRGWQALTRAPRPAPLQRLTAFEPGRPREVASILTAADNGLPGIRDWFHPDAEVWWRRFLGQERITFATLLLAPAVVLALALLFATTDAPPWTYATALLAALPAPWAAVRFVKQPQRDWAETPWDHPEWHFTGWIGALAALPVLAQFLPATPIGVAIMALAAVPALAWTTVALPLRSDILPWHRVGGIIRTAWPLGVFFSIGAEYLTPAGIGIWGIMALALAIGWWRGGDTITEAIARRIPRFTLPILVAVVSIAMLALIFLTNGLKPADAVLPVYLAIVPAVILLFVANRVVPAGRIKLLLAIGWLMVAIALFGSLGRVLPPQQTTVPAVAAPIPVTPPSSWVRDTAQLATVLKPGFRFDYALAVDRSGAITGCQVRRSSGNDAIDTAMCMALTRNGRFTPARDSHDIAVAASYEASLSWSPPRPGAMAMPPRGTTAMPPRGTPAHPLVSINDWIVADDYPDGAMPEDRAYTIAYTLDIDTLGRVSTCSVDKSSGSRIADRATCAAVKARARFAPARDSAGAPVESRFAAQVTWRRVPPRPALPPSKPLGADRAAPDATLSAPPPLPRDPVSLRPRDSGANPA